MPPLPGYVPPPSPQPPPEEEEPTRRRRKRYRRVVTYEREPREPAGDIRLTEAQREVLTREQARRYRQLTEAEQIRFKRELAHRLERARQQARRQARRLEAKRGARTNPATTFQIVTGNPMDAIQPRGGYLSHVRRKPQDRPRP